MCKAQLSKPTRPHYLPKVGKLVRHLNFVAVPRLWRGTATTVGKIDEF